MKSEHVVLVLLLALQQPALAVESTKKGANNESELSREFSLTNAPKFETSERQQRESDRVVGQLTNGYAGTLVLATAGDPNLDTPAFLSRYLREFSALNQNPSIGAYDFRFERILARVSGHPEMLNDARLDWDMWRSFLLYESFWDGSDYYPYKSADGTPEMHLLDSARDLLWNYLDRHAETLLMDKVRRRWWIEHLTHRLEESEGRHMRRWYLLLLCSHADDDARQPAVQSIGEPRKNRGEDPGVPLRKPSGLDPFLITKKDAKSPVFADALSEIARPLGLDLTVWGIDLHTMAPTRSLQLHLELAKWPVDDSYIIGQESWSDEKNGPYEWGVRFYRSVGRRAAYGNVSLPSQDRKDGVYFYAFKKRLYVWPKAQMDAGVLQMLQVARLIDDVEWKRLQGRGFRELRATLTKP